MDRTRVGRALDRTGRSLQPHQAKTQPQQPRSHNHSGRSATTAAPKGRPNLAQRFSAGKRQEIWSSPGGTARITHHGCAFSLARLWTPVNAPNHNEIGGFTLRPEFPIVNYAMWTKRRRTLRPPSSFC